ncbi:hypothetical protein [Lactobacillus paragasseri]|uniref:Uncharacterized protein n=1 Tax=Lactobacillus paragasseri TaxID=2107999 RepID=A0ABD4ZZ27_9LACO|nr:hypothetical protein [Lactobacillus paragasseri]MDK7952116.1 hypothetical protein [Lactobacillus paragasseri]MDO6360770.1 hypothetical protein [Lactobacillus paragasseri]MDX5059213.1 hypothetical protein [Lactobacillus paragasseri]
MKREIISLCAIALVGVSIGALGLSNHHSSNIKQADEATTKVSKTHKKSSKKSVNAAKPKEKSQSQSKQTTNVDVQQSKQSSSTATSQSQTQNTATQQQQQPQKTQGEINKERGYDPKGNPVIPGQDHAPGSNPDGSADSWVKGQSEWLRQNGLTNSDGTLTQKAKDQRAQEFKNESE